VASIAAHENKAAGFRRHPREAAQVSNGVTRRVQQVEAPVAKVVERPESTNLQVPAFFLHVDFSNLAAFEVIFSD
jgi:hypothetical protein